jgi:hypothetical protein
MGIVKQANAKIPEDQYQLIVDVLMNIPETKDFYTTLISKIAKSLIPDNNVIVTNGVHQCEYDTYGPYHFNIIYKYMGKMYNTQRHVYVEPFLVDVANYGIEIDEDKSVFLGCRNYWVYSFKYITSA